MTKALEERLQEEYEFSPTVTHLAIKLHNAVKDKPYSYKMLGIVLSPFSSGFPKTQEAIYEIMGMGPKEDAYKITLWKSLDRRGLIMTAIAYTTGVSIYSMGASHYLPDSYVAFTNQHMLLGLYAVIAENAIVTTASYITKKPLIRPLTLLSLNPVLWFDTLRFGKHAVEKAGKTFSQHYEATLKQVAAAFTGFLG